MLTGINLGTTASWIIIVIGASFLLSLLLALYAWRDTSRAAYFFQKREAQQKMQSYTLTTIILFVLMITVSSYAATPPITQEPIIKVITNAKPQQKTLTSEEDDNDDVVLLTSTSLTEDITLPTQLNPLAVRAVAIEPTLPDQFQTLEAEIDVLENSSISDIAFSREIDDSYAPTAASTEFPSGYFNLYATFDYTEMENGINWAWVWKHEGNVVGGGEQVWEYGNTGPGYVYFNPTDGFDKGEYSLEIWLNGELVNERSMDVISSLAQ